MARDRLVLDLALHARGHAASVLGEHELSQWHRLRSNMQATIGINLSACLPAADKQLTPAAIGLAL